MNQKQLAILVALVVVIGGIGIVAYKGKMADWSPGGSGGADESERVVSDFPLNDVSEINIKTRDSEVTLAKSDSGWAVKERAGYPADFGDIHELLRTVWEMEPVQKPKAGKSNLGRLQLVDPESATEDDDAATRVTFKAGGSAHTLFLGKEHMRKSQGQGPMGGGSFSDGRYVMVGDDLTTISLVEATFGSVTASPKDWLSKDFVKVEKIKSIQYRPLESTNGWSLSRESDSGDYVLAGIKEDETLDTSGISGLKFFLSSPSFVDVAAGKSDEETGLDKPVSALIETFEGLKYELSLGNKDEADQYFIKFSVEAQIAKERTPGADEKPEDKAKLDKEHLEKVKTLEEKVAAQKKLEGNVYVVSKFTVEALLKDRKDLLKGPEEEAAPNAGGSPIPGLPPGIGAPPTGANAGAPQISQEMLDQIMKQAEAQAQGAADKVKIKAEDSVNKVDANIKKEAEKLLKNGATLPPVPKAIAPKAPAPKAATPKVETPKVETPKPEADAKK